MSPNHGQMLLQSSENFGKILARTLNNETNKLLETQENIGTLLFKYVYEMVILFSSDQN